MCFPSNFYYIGLCIKSVSSVPPSPLCVIGLTKVTIFTIQPQNAEKSKALLDYIGFIYSRREQANPQTQAALLSVSTLTTYHQC